MWNQPRLMIWWMGVIFLPGVLSGQDDDRLVVDLGSDVTAYLPLPASDLPRVVFPSSPSPFVVFDGVVYDVSEKKAVGKVHKVPHPAELSDDGKYFAYDNREGGATKSIVVLDCSTGTVVHRLDVPLEDRRRECSMLAFTTAGQLLATVAGDEQGYLFRWNVEDGSPLPKMRTSRVSAISPNGRLLGATGAEGLIVVDVDSGRARVSPEQPELPDDGKKSKQLHVLAFSPDSSLLAGYVGRNIVVWNGRGEVIEQHRLKHGSSAMGVQLRWLPDNSGWILRGPRVFLRRAGGIVWEADRCDSLAGLVDLDHLIFVRRRNQSRQLVAMKWQRDQVLKSVEQMENGTALLRPGDQIGINIDFGEVRFGQRDAVIQQLGETITQRLAQDGIRVAADCDLRLCLIYGESAGGTRTVGDKPRHMDAFEIHRAITLAEISGSQRDAAKFFMDQGLVTREGPLLVIRGGMVKPPPGSRPRGSAESTDVNVHLSLLQRGKKVPFWQMRTPTRFGYRDEGKPLSARFLRDAAAKGVLAHLSKADFPYVVPSAPDLPSLPITRNIAALELIDD